jgi:hypothetical protein
MHVRSCGTVVEVLERMLVVSASQPNAGISYT